MKIRNTVVKTKTLIEHEQTKSAKSKRTLSLIDETVPYLKSLKAQRDRFKPLFGNHDADPAGHVCACCWSKECLQSRFRSI